MLTTLVEQASKLLGSAYLVSALTPWLIFWLANAATLAAALGPIASLGLLERLSASTVALAAVSFLSVVFVILGALLVASLTTVFQAILQGRYLGPPLGLFLRGALHRMQQRVIEHRHESQRLFDEWTASQAAIAGLSGLTNAYAESERRKRPQPTPEGIASIESEFGQALGDGSSADKIAAAVQVLTRAYDMNAPSPFEPLHRKVDEAARSNEATAREAYAALERRRAETFADALQVAPTDYGNALAASEGYVWRVYGIESAVLWTRLQKVISKEYLAVVHDAKVRLDFFTAMTLFAGGYGAIWFFVLPYLLPSAWLLAAVVGSASVATWVCYRAAVEAAAGFGQVFRASFDLFRRALLKDLGIDPPATLAKERALWERLSAITVFQQPASGNDDIPLGAPPRVATNPDANFE